MTLVDMKIGEKADVLQINKGSQAERRLFEIGIVPGARIELLSRHPFKGPLVLKIGGARIALGRKIASNIEVKLVDESVN